MKDGTQRPSVEELLAQSSWLRHLATTLVAGDAAAEDLVQETWLTTLGHPPRDPGSARPWLARIARNLAANFRRGEARRKEREGSARPREPEPDPSSAVEEVEAQRVLAEAVLRLAEPLRTAIVLRYLRGLDSRAIGRVQDVPPGTVRWRLKRGLELLRADLDRRFGERGSWCVAFTVLFGDRGGASATAGVPVASVSTKIGAAAALATASIVALFGVTWLASSPGTRGLAEASAERVVEIAQAADSAETELVPPTRADGPASVPGTSRVKARSAALRSASAASPRRGAPIRGQLRIADTEDRLDEVLTLRLRAGDMSVKETVKSAPDGSFRSKRSFPRGFVLAEVLRPAGDPAGDCEAFFDPSSDEGFLLPVPWPNFVRGRLVDRAGQHLEDFEIQLLQGKTEGELERGNRTEGGFFFTDLDPGPCKVTVRRGCERYQISTTVARGPNELGDVVVPFRERAGPVRGRLRSLHGKPDATVVLTDLATGVSFEAVSARSTDEVAEFEFENVLRGDYRLTVFSHDGLRYADRTRFLRPPASDVEFVAIGENEPLQIRALDGESELPGWAWVLSAGRWCQLNDGTRPVSLEPKDVERWIVVAPDHRPVSGGTLESTRVDVRPEPGWGFALFLHNSTPSAPGQYCAEPINGFEVLADGIPVARSEDGLALMSLPHAPGRLEGVLDGWVVVAGRGDGSIPIQDGELCWFTDLSRE